MGHPQDDAAQLEPAQASRLAEELRRASQWRELAALVRSLPKPVTPPWVETAEAVAFALSQEDDFATARAILTDVMKLAPSHRCASSLAYLCYAELMDRRTHDREARAAAATQELKRQFRGWMGEALRLRPDSIRDLYRLGVFEAQLESRHDRVALKAFAKAISSYRALPQAERDRRHWERKPYIKALYAGARSALRLRRLTDARRLSFDCLREDRDSQYVAQLHKLYLAGRVCARLGEHDHAERAYRAALAADGPRERDFIYSALAELELARNAPERAIAWIDHNVRVERRKSYSWRLLGDAEAERGRWEIAVERYRAALRRDRSGRHLTLYRLGCSLEQLGRNQEAERAFEDARAFKRKVYMSEDEPSLRGAARVAHAMGHEDRAAALEAMLAAHLATRSGGAHDR